MDIQVSQHHLLKILFFQNGMASIGIFVKKKLAIDVNFLYFKFYSIDLCFYSYANTTGMIIVDLEYILKSEHVILPSLFFFKSVLLIFGPCNFILLLELACPYL